MLWRLMTWPFKTLWNIVKGIVSFIIHVLLLPVAAIGSILSALRKIFEIYRDNMRWSVQFMWVGCAILLLGLTMLLFVLSPFYVVPLIGSDLVLKSRTTYTLSSESLKALNAKVRAQELPYEVYKSVLQLKNKAIKGEKEFLAAVAERIGEDSTQTYKRLILENALTSYILTEDSFKGLERNIPEKIVKSLLPLQDRKLIGEDAFLKNVRERIGENLVKEHEALFLTYARNQSSAPRYILNARAFNALRTAHVPDELLQSLTPLQDEMIAGEANFVNSIRTQLGRGAMQRYQELFVSSAHLDKYRLNERSLAYLQIEGVDDKLLMKLRPLANLPKNDGKTRELFLEDVKKYLEKEPSDEERELLLRYAAMFSLTERAFEQLRCAEIPDYILRHVDNPGLTDREITGEVDFLAEVKQALEVGLTESYKGDLLVYARHAGFTLTEKSLRNLRQRQIPDKVIKQLDPLKNIEIPREDILLKKLRQYLGAEDGRIYQNAILEEASNERFTLSHWDLEALKGVEGQPWQALKDREFLGRSSLLNSLPTHLGEQDARKYEALILKNVRISLEPNVLLIFLEKRKGDQQLARLKLIEGQEFVGEKNFLAEVTKQIGEEKSGTYDEYLLEKVASYSLAEESLLLLDEWVERIPAKLVNDLAPLKEREIARHEIFQQELKQLIGEQETAKYGAMITEKASSWSFTLTDWDLEALRGIEGQRWQTLKDREFSGKESFLRELRFHLGGPDGEKFQQSALRHVRISLPKREKFPMALRMDEELSKLEELQDRTFVGEDNFHAAIQEQIGEKNSEKYYEELVNQSASFSLTKESFQTLAHIVQRVPEDLLNDIRILKKKESLGEHTFLTALKKRVGEKKTAQYKAPILQYALNVTHTLSDESFKELGDVAERLRPLKNIEIFSKDKFVGAITQLLGEAEMQEYEHQSRILQHVEISFSVNELMLKSFKDKKLTDEAFLASLRTLKPIETIGENAFVKMVQDCLGEKDKVDMYRNYLLNESFFTLTEASLQSLKNDASLRLIPEELRQALQTLKNRDVNGGEEIFLASLREILGEEYTQQYKKVILEKAEKTHPVLRFDLSAALGLIGNTIATTEFLFIVSCMALFVGLALLASLSVTLTSLAISLWEFIDEITSSRLTLVMMFVVAMSVLLVLALIKGYIVL